MKVTVCFDNVKVIVPCGDGDLLVKELIDRAVIRYKKAAGKPNDSWVTVHSLKTLNEGILDPDDHLNDVVDDREQLIAIYEEPHVSHAHNNGDGASASSVGTSSPDIFQNNNGPSGASNGDFKTSALSDNDVIVTSEDVPSGPVLRVRRGSEPALVGLGEDEATPAPAVKLDTPTRHKRWSTFGNDGEFQTSTPKLENGNSEIDQTKCLQPRWNSTGHNKNKHIIPQFSREICRQSLGTGPGMHKWYEAQERQEEKLKDDGREEPVGGGNERYNNSNVAEKELEIIVTLKNDGEPLGIHVLPDYDDNDKETGLVLQHIELGSKVSCDGRLKIDDRIIEINGVSLKGISFDRAQNIFRDAMKTDEIQLKVLKSNPPPLPKKPPPLLPKPKARNQTAQPKPNPLKLPSTQEEEPKKEVDSSKNGNTNDTRMVSSQCSNNLSDDAIKCDSDLDKENRQYDDKDTSNATSCEDNSTPSSPNKKVPPAVPARHPTTALSTKDKPTFSASTNTRKIGRKLNIQLKKGTNGLGFSITSRDNPTGGTIPIYIKNILPQGAAIEDGQLKSGDRLLEVNGIEMSGKTQVEAVTILRNTKMGSEVQLLVSRQHSDEAPTKPPRENAEKKNVSRPSSTSPATSVDNRETSPVPSEPIQDVLVLNIPLNGTGSAGLGVSVKGNSNPSETGANRDLGIFVKAIINGGAASKDGRLKVNDQLIEINEQPLLGHTNQKAMETLRQTMRSIDPVNGNIRLIVARQRRDTASPSISMISLSEDTNSNHKSSFSDDTESIDDNVVNKNLRDTKGLRNIDNVKNLNMDVNGNNSGGPLIELTKPLTLQIKRLRGGGGKDSGLNNDSYNRAVHSSFEDSTGYIDNKDLSPTPERKSSNSSAESKYSLAKAYSGQGLRSVTVNPPEQETVLIEEDSFVQDDGYPPVFAGEGPLANCLAEQQHKREEMQPQQDQKPPLRLPPKPAPPPPAHSHSNNNSNHHHQHPPPYLVTHPSQDYRPEPFYRPVDPKDNWQPQYRMDDNEISPLSPDFDPNLAFQREAFGRQSMSEKRRGHMDARHSEFYQLAKNNRGDPGGKPGTLVRAGSMESLMGNKSNTGTILHDNISNRGLHSDVAMRKRSSSMESLPTPDHVFENPAPPFWAAERANRIRMCNESFRAAVDRSYDVSHLSQNMETLEEENSDTGSQVGQGWPTHPMQTSVSHTDGTNTEEQQQTKTNKKKERDNRKSGGFLKGFFKFNKGNKEEKATKDHSTENGGKQKNDKPAPEILEMDRNWKNPRADLDRCPEHPRSPHPTHQPQRPRPVYPRETHPGELFPPNGMGGNRVEKIQQLREEHQRKHQARQGRYPLDDQEEMHEKHLQELEKRKFSNYGSHPGQQPYKEAEYAVVNKPRHPGGRTNQHERMNVRPNYIEHPGQPPYNYMPEPNGDERFCGPNYSSESHPKYPPPYSHTGRDGWHGDGYRVPPPRPQTRQHRDETRVSPNYDHPENAQGNHEPWIYVRPGGQSVPPSWQHQIPTESPAVMDDHYNYNIKDGWEFSDPTYAVIPGKRTPNQNQTANV